MPIKVNEPFALRRLMVVKCRDGSLAASPVARWRGSYTPDNGHEGRPPRRQFEGPLMVDNPVWEICEHVAEVQALLDDHDLAADVVAKAQARYTAKAYLEAHNNGSGTHRDAD